MRRGEQLVSPPLSSVLAVPAQGVPPVSGRCLFLPCSTVVVLRAVSAGSRSFPLLLLLPASVSFLLAAYGSLCCCALSEVGGQLC